MKTRIILLLSLSVGFFSCTEGELAKSPLWGVDYSSENSTVYAQGAIDQQNAEGKVTYIVREGALRQSQGERYSVNLTFATGETMQLGIIKKTTDYNYHYPGEENQNQLVSVVFNGTPLDLETSAVAILPETGDNKLNVITNVHTKSLGAFNGTSSRIPLLKSSN